MSVVLAIDDVALAFGGVKALDGVSFDVSQGEVVGLIGPNGAGKTTLFDCISGFSRPQRGSISLTLPGRKPVAAAASRDTVTSRPQLCPSVQPCPFK